MCTQVRFKTFPRYLVLHMQRYVQKPDWTIGKLNVEVPAPETLDLSALRATGLQPGETVMAEEAAAPAAATAAPGAAAAPAAAPQPDEAIIAQLVGMGFSENGSKRAAIAVNNSSARPARSRRPGSQQPTAAAHRPTAAAAHRGSPPRQPTAAEAHPHARGCPLAPRGILPPRGHRGEAAPMTCGPPRLPSPRPS